MNGGSMSKWMGDGWVNKWSYEWVNEKSDEWVNEWSDEWVKGWSNEWVNEWGDEYVCFVWFKSGGSHVLQNCKQGGCWDRTG